MKQASRQVRRVDERGGVVVIVAVLFGLGVLLGASALTIDVSSIMWERRQVQNGADAAAMALALACSKDAANCSESHPDIQLLNNANATDGSSSNDGVCKRFPATFVGSAIANSCSSAAYADVAQQQKLANLRECAPLPGWLTGAGSDIPYVEVKTGTSTGGSAPTLLPSYISQAITGTDNLHVTACARAAWGPPGSFTGSLPLAISSCEWQKYTGASTVAGIPGSFVDPPVGGGTGYGGPGQPSYPDAYSGWPNKVGDEIYVLTHSTENHCNYNGKDTAGGFGWLDDGSSCSTTLSTTNNVDFWAKIGTGNNVPSSCKSVIDSYYGKVIQLPVFDCLQKSATAPTQPISYYTSCQPGAGGGSQTWYHLAGFASFYLSGNKLDNTVGKNSVINGKLPCSTASPVGAEANPWTGNSGRCISGWFVSGTLTAPSIGIGGTGGGNFGTTAVAPAG